jgi:molybdate transport system regulatory protein
LNLKKRLIIIAPNAPIPEALVKPDPPSSHHLRAPYIVLLQGQCYYPVKYYVLEGPPLPVKIRCKAWLEADGRFVLGPGGLEILKTVEETGNLRLAAEKLGMSYSFVWRYIKRLESALGINIVETWRGGRERGGARLSEEAGLIIDLYSRLIQEAEKLAKVYEEQLNRELGIKK